MVTQSMSEINKNTQQEAQSSAQELYKKNILEHSSKPRHNCILEFANASATKNNQLCGDEITVYCRSSGEILEAVSFVGTGCAIMKASASLMTEVLHEGNTSESALNLLLVMTDFLNGDDSALAPDSPLRSLVGVRGFPSRIKCALLPFQALRDALLSAHPRNS
jgi:nitrogen fixation NifU-like protein